MMTTSLKSFIPWLHVILAALVMQSCSGILSGVYDEPSDEEVTTVAGQLYIDASEWDKWHYIDLQEVADSTAANSDFNPSVLWSTFDIPTQEISDNDTRNGIYTYWYDVFGSGISVNEFRSFYPTAPQPQPQKWSIAVHRNNVRTNGASVAETGFRDLDEIPHDKSFLNALIFQEDTWSETDVWCEQSRMLLGLIGNQGIMINTVLSSWLDVDIPPIPPSFAMHDNVFIIRLKDGSYGALQLVNYQSQTGTKCCLTINYRYPI